LSPYYQYTNQCNTTNRNSCVLSSKGTTGFNDRELLIKSRSQPNLISIIPFSWFDFKIEQYAYELSLRNQLLRDIAISDNGKHLTFLFQTEGHIGGACWNQFIVVECYLNLIDAKRYPYIRKTIIENPTYNQEEAYLSRDANTITIYNTYESESTYVYRRGTLVPSVMYTKS
jgi:hypothetical protein